MKSTNVEKETLGRATLKELHEKTYDKAEKVLNSLDDWRLRSLRTRLSVR